MINIVDERNKIKTLLSITTNEQNDLIDLIIEDSVEFFFNYTNVGELYMGKHASLIRQICIIRFNKLGSEGASSENYSGGSISYVDGLPSEIVKELNSIRRVVF